MPAHSSRLPTALEAWREKVFELQLIRSASVEVESSTARRPGTHEEHQGAGTCDLGAGYIFVAATAIFPPAVTATSSL